MESEEREEGGWTGPGVTQMGHVEARTVEDLYSGKEVQVSVVDYGLGD